MKKESYYIAGSLKEAYEMKTKLESKGYVIKGMELGWHSTGHWLKLIYSLDEED